MANENLGKMSVIKTIYILRVIGKRLPFLGSTTVGIVERDNLEELRSQKLYRLLAQSSVS